MLRPNGSLARGRSKAHGLQNGAMSVSVQGRTQDHTPVLAILCPDRDLPIVLIRRPDSG